MSEDVPDQFIERQLNDTRYISKLVKGLLSNIVREEGELEATSKNLIPVTGNITNILKRDWGLNDKWNEIIAPRFQRLNKITGTDEFGYYDTDNWGKRFFRITVPDDLKKNFSKKRIDHRHHAMDALIIACATRDHVGLLNNEYAKSDNKRYDLNRKLRNFKQINKNGKAIEIPANFLHPWQGFPVNAKNAIEEIVVSFKQNIRVITKTKNYYQKWVKENGHLKKKLVVQEGRNLAVRKPLHKETYFGKIEKAGKSYSVVRKEPDSTFNSKKIEDSVCDKDIKNILSNHLNNYNEVDINGKIKERPDLAFSGEGMEKMNNNIVSLNDGKPHKPIYKVRVKEDLGNKFRLGDTGNKTSKYVEAAKGTNLYFAIYYGLNKKGEKVRVYETIPLKTVIERLKQGWKPVHEKYIDEKNNMEYRLLFSLSPNDLVYVPDISEENEIKYTSKEVKKDRLYRMIKTSGKQCYFIQNNVAAVIKQYDRKSGYGEFGSQNKLEIIDGKIKIEHISPTNEVLGVYEGETALELRDILISENLFGNPAHALYLGTELMKAEIALKNGLEYEQDTPLRFEKQTETTQTKEPSTQFSQDTPKGFQTKIVTYINAGGREIKSISMQRKEDEFERILRSAGLCRIFN